MIREACCEKNFSGNTNTVVSKERVKARRHGEMKQLTPWILLLLMLPSFAAPDIKAWFDRDGISLGDTVTLTVEAAEDNQAALDLEPLEEDFQVLGTSIETHLDINSQTAKTQWVIELAPKRSGTIQVPSLVVGNGQTAPLTLSVKGQTTANAQDPSQQALFLEVQADSQAPYIQSQVRFTVRLLYNEPILEGGLDVPDIEDAIIERLGEDVAYSTTRYGKRYSVFERRYVLFPQRSGTLTIPPIGFEGRVRTTDDWRFGLGLRLGRRVRLTSESVTLEVRPQPTHYGGKHWLPTPELTLKEDWPAESPRLKVGEPLTRTLVLEAQGLTAGQLPTLRIPEQPNIRLYTDQPKTETHQDGDTIVGHREERIAIIPTESGELVLPEMTLTWWDTDTNQERIARLPARTLTVLPAVEAVSPLTQPTQSSERSDAHLPRQSDALRSPTLQDVFWPGVSAVLLSLWLLTLLVWWRTNRSTWTLPEKNSAPEPPLARDAKRALQRACYQGDPQAAAKALLLWASAVWPQSPPKNLGDLADRLAIDPTPIQDLDRRLYAASANSWHGGALWLSVKGGLKEKEASTKISYTDLPPLYPNI
jgi:hypothetical protein